MSTTVTCEILVQPGHEEAIIQMAADQLARPGHIVAGRRYARLYQHADEATRLLYLAEWESQQAFDAYRAQAPHPGRREQLRAAPQFRFYQRLALFEQVFAPIDLVCVSFVTTKQQQLPAVREAAHELHRGAGRRFPGLVTLLTGERNEQSANVLVASGWQRRGLPAPQHEDAAERPPDEALLAQLLVTGASVERFIGHHVIDGTGHVPPR